MIQRIQSVYLGLGIVAYGVFFSLGPDAWDGTADEAVGGWFTPTVGIAAGLATLAAIIGIFLYNNRDRQRGIVMVAQYVSFALLAVIIIGLYTAGAVPALTGDSQLGTWAAILIPVLGFSFFLLARKGIEKDINLIRSMDRLR